jgi:hypothetical protein
MTELLDSILEGAKFSWGILCTPTVSLSRCSAYINGRLILYPTNSVSNLPSLQRPRENFTLLTSHMEAIHLYRCGKALGETEESGKEFISLDKLQMEITISSIRLINTWD